MGEERLFLWFHIGVGISNAKSNSLRSLGKRFLDRKLLQVCLSVSMTGRRPGGHGPQNPRHWAHYDEADAIADAEIPLRQLGLQGDANIGDFFLRHPDR